MKLHILLATTLLAMASVTTTHGENDNACTGLEAGLLAPKGNLPPAVLDRIRIMARRMETMSVPTGLACTDLSKVLGRLVNGSAPGGKRLHDEQPLDIVAAQTELEQALQHNPELRTQLDALRATVADDQERMLFEAALLQSNNLYGARDLRLQQFIARAKGG